MLYLASQSPRRQALLTQVGIPFDILSFPNSCVLEIPEQGEAPAAYVRRMACSKALAGLRHARRHNLPPHPVLGADTEVVLGDHIFGKPHDRQDAIDMLQALSGKTHQVISAVALCLPATPEGSADAPPHTSDVLVTTRVTFRPLSAHDITSYIDSGEPFGKAGAYAIQGRGAAFVSHLEGSYSSVVGLPLFETLRLLDTLNITPAPGDPVMGS